jgi:hypothetical protein
MLASCDGSLARGRVSVRLSFFIGGRHHHIGELHLEQFSCHSTGEKFMVYPG